MIKTILVPTGGSDTDLVVFETALAAARLFRAHLEFFHVRVDAGEALTYSPHASFARGQGLRKAIEDQLQESELRRRAGKRHFQHFCKRRKLSVTDTPGRYRSVSASWREEPGHEEHPFVTRARLHDLVVMARATRLNGLPPDLLELLLFGSGRPMLIASSKAPQNLVGTVMICWKDSPEPSRAITAAMPLLTKAKRVVIATVEEGRPSANVAVARQLAWHGVRAKAQTIKGGARPIATLLSSVAKDCGADLLVMGAYSTGPLRQMISGGCTQSILEHADVPVFMLH